MKILITGGSGFIGTNLIDALIAAKKFTILNIDTVQPKVKEHEAFYKQASIMDEMALAKVFSDFKPELIIHLAARTDTAPQNTLQDYELNTKGSENLIREIEKCSSVQRVIFTSTQFVHQYHGFPKHDEDFAPHTVYGESKVRMEQMVRASKMSCAWTIIRPTNIWGPWHLRYPFEFWKVLRKGMYFHPGRRPVVRSYGYVGTVVDQMIAILNADLAKINHHVFYVGDPPIDLYDWVNGFSLKQNGHPVRVVPRIIVRMMAIAGDMLALAKLPFPITSSRYRSMTNSNTAPMDKTFEAFGMPARSLQKGIDETVDWMKKYHPELVKSR